MSNEISEGLDAIPFYGVLKRLRKFVTDPSIRDTAIGQNDLKYYIKDFLESLLLIGTIIDLLCFCLPDIIKLDLSNMLSSIRFAFLIGFDEFVQVVVFYTLLLFILTWRKRGWHFNLARQALRSFAVTNFLLVLGFLIEFSNRIYAKITDTNPCLCKTLIALLILIIGYGLLFLVLVLPVWKYLSKYYSKIVCVVFIILSISTAKVVANKINPFPPTLAVNKQSFCEQYVKIRYRSQIELGQYNYFRLLDKHLEAYDKLIQQ